MPLIPSTLNPQTNSGSNSTSSWTNLLMGKKLGDNHDATTFAKKELPSKHRIVDAEGGVMTADHVPERLNVHVDKDGTVRKVTHG